MKALLIIGLLLISIVQASPTENEFIICKKMSVSLLERCLNKHSWYSNKSCWINSQKSFDACAKDIVYSHNPKAQAERNEDRKEMEEILKENAQE